MSGRRYSGRHYRRRRSPVPGILLLIVAAALVLGALAIFTDVFKKDRPADRADDPAVTQPDDTQKPDDAQQPSGGADGQDGQTGGDTQQPDNSGSQTGSKTLDTITTDATPYQSGGVYIVGDTGFEMYNYVDSLAKNYGEIVTSVADQLSGVSGCAVQRYSGQRSGSGGEGYSGRYGEECENGAPSRCDDVSPRGVYLFPHRPPLDGAGRVLRLPRVLRRQGRDAPRAVGV